MTLLATTGFLRVLCAVSWISLMSWVVYFWLGFAGVGFVCVASTAWLREVFETFEQKRIVSWASINHVWLWPWFVGVDSGGGMLWFFRDEHVPSQWAELNRGLRLHVPRQAIGLSISR